MRRTLHLSRETLAELEADDLARVGGADAPPTLQAYVCPTIPILGCLVQTVWKCATDVCAP